MESGTESALDARDGEMSGLAFRVLSSKLHSVRTLQKEQATILTMTKEETIY